MSARKIGTVPVWSCRCERCGHTWEAMGKEPPEACAACRSRYWGTKAGTLRRGPKPKSKTKPAA